MGDMRMEEQAGLLQHEEFELDEKYAEDSTPHAARQISTLRTLQVLGSKLSLASKLTFRRVFSPHSPSSDGPFTLRILSLLPTILTSLLPRFLRRNGLSPTKKEHVTTYLDALRGWAAIVVVNHHWNHHSPYKTWWIVSQPVFTLFDSGNGAVDVFFIISGYVLSYRLLKLARQQQSAQLLDAVVSSVFRRYLRLYGSAMIASFFAMSLIGMGWSEDLGTDARRMGSFFPQIWDWVLDMVHYCNLFENNMPGFWYPHVFSSRYLDPLWTIPVEFRGSMVVFAFCTAGAKLSNRSRMVLCGFLILCAYVWAANYVVCFLSGVLLADLSFTRFPERHFPTPPLSLDKNVNPHEEKAPQISRTKKVFYWITFLISLFLLGEPKWNLQDAFHPWPFLDSLTPNSWRIDWLQMHFWLSIGAIMLVFSLDSYPVLQTPLRWRFSRYLGDISFGIYVIHRPLLWSVYDHILNPLRAWALGEHVWAHLISMSCLYVVVLWGADLFVRIDERVVASGKWLQNRLFTW